MDQSELPPNHLDKPRPFGEGAQNMDPEAESGEVEASEEEQAQYDLVVSRALKYIHGDGRDNVLSTLGSSETPAQGIGLVTAKLARMMRKSAQEQGKDIDDEVLINAGAEIAEDLSELGQTVGVFQFDNEEEAQEQLEEGLYWAMKYYGEEAMQAGELDHDGAKAAMQQGIAREQQQMGAPSTVRGGVNRAVNEMKAGNGLIGSTMKRG